MQRDKHHFCVPRLTGLRQMHCNIRVKIKAMWRVVDYGFHSTRAKVSISLKLAIWQLVESDFFPSNCASPLPLRQ